MVEEAQTLYQNSKDQRDKIYKAEGLSRQYMRALLNSNRAELLWNKVLICAKKVSSDSCRHSITIHEQIISLIDEAVLGGYGTIDEKIEAIKEKLEDQANCK
jgi:hypothetical protein